MEKNQKLLGQIVSDLGLNAPFVKGETIKIKNCWHFSTDGNAVDQMFYDESDFIDGMNRIYVTSLDYKITILAFSLMDTHVHFILYGEFDECNRFIHDYVKRTSRHISNRYQERHKFDGVPINHQQVDTDFYLKTVICYTVKNAPVAGLRHNALDYPWSSGPLYFKTPGLWCSPRWTDMSQYNACSSQMTLSWRRDVLKTRKQDSAEIRMIDRLIFPGEYVAYGIVEQIFKTCRSFNFFLCRTKEEDVDARGGSISHLSIPMQEMRQHKNEICKKLFGTNSIKGLTTQQRLHLARTMKARYNSSLKQIIRLSGLVYDEVKDRL